MMVVTAMSMPRINLEQQPSSKAEHGCEVVLEANGFENEEGLSLVGNLLAGPF